ncbi:MAG: hypothetical protein DDT34_01223 [Firmicutes bacterium]|nr:hypothetical protein [candidate division NPL-UPA2 bacterium]MBT9136150.1 hypothetical protein [Bacillota bacterium]MBT9156414.1 hypothetical protein [candidate division NPL-UPA2 bacterium]
MPNRAIRQKKEEVVLPRLQFYALPLPVVTEVSEALVDELAALMNVAREHFVLEHIATTYVYDGVMREGFPYVEVHCFDRGAEVFDRTAEIITGRLQALGVASVDVAFRPLIRRHYYENGKPLYVQVK